MLFEKPSLRPKLTFEIAIKQLGGGSVFMEGPIGVREPLKDVARNLDRWVNAIVARVFSQTTIEDLARWSPVPVINALSDAYHPCQALADVETIRGHAFRHRLPGGLPAESGSSCAASTRNRPSFPAVSASDSQTGVAVLPVYCETARAHFGCTRGKRSGIAMRKTDGAAGIPQKGDKQGWPAPPQTAPPRFFPKTARRNRFLFPEGKAVALLI